MGFMQKAVAAMVTKYGKVISGKYEGHFICLGHDPEKENKPKVINTAAPKLYEFIIFMMDDEGKARHNIVKEIAKISKVDEDDDTITVEFVWCTGEYSTVSIFKKKVANTEESGVAKGIGLLMKMGGAGSKTANSPESKERETYGDCGDFMFSVLLCLDLEMLEWYRDFGCTHGLLEGSFLAIVDKAIVSAQAKAQAAEEIEE